MKSSWIAIGVLCLAVAGCTNMKGSDAKAGAENETKVPFDQLPVPVQTALTREAAGAPVNDIDEETENGRTIYEADVTIGGKNYEIKLAEDGKVLSKKLDDEADEKTQPGGANKGSGNNEQGAHRN